jgi:hypothetical protein
MSANDPKRALVLNRQKNSVTISLGCRQLQSMRPIDYCLSVNAARVSFSESGKVGRLKHHQQSLKAASIFAVDVGSLKDYLEKCFKQETYTENPFPHSARNGGPYLGGERQNLIRDF